MVCPTAAQQIVFQEYVHTVTEQTERVQRLEVELHTAVIDVQVRSTDAGHRDLDERLVRSGLGQLVLDDAPLMPMMHHTYERLFQPYVRAIEVNGLGDPYIPFRKIWLERAR